MLRTASISTPAAPDDGLRLLVARFRGRGRADRYDVWMPSLGPSERLLRTFLDGDIPWRDFASRYRKEMFAPGAVDADNRTIRNRGQLHTMRLIKHLAASGNVTLMCHCDEDTSECHRFLLRDLIASKRV